MKKILALIAMALILAMMPFALFSCKDNDPEPTDDLSDVDDSGSGSDSESDSESESKDNNKNEKTTFKIVRNLDKIKLLGRTTKLTTGLGVDHTASGIEFRGNFEGDVKIKIKQAKLKDGCNETYFTVYVDGERQNERFKVNGTTLKTLTLASFAKKGEHTIRIVKQTESNYTTSEFVELVFKGEMLDAPTNNAAYIEFIGDSLTCGMGNLPDANGSYPSEPGIAQTSPYEDGTQSYGYITAEVFGADYSIVSESGIGLAKTWFDPMPAFYTANSYNRNPKSAYSFERVPNLVVINLGTNDYYLESDETEFETKVKEFIGTVRESYGKNMPIVWVSRFVGIGDNYVSKIDSAIAALGGESAGLFRLDVTRNTGGAQGHPTVAGHEKAASELVSFINSKNLLAPKEYDAVSYLNLATNSEKVRHLGRTQVLPTGIAVDHTASGIEFKGTFEGDVKMTIKSSSNNAPDGKKGKSSYFTVHVDGVRLSTRFETPDGITTLTLYTFATKGEHTIKIEKQTESNYTICDFVSLSFKGELLNPPANKDLYLEFIGDSITCGMGNLPDENNVYPQAPDIAQTSPYEDGTQSYGYMAAETLGADVNIVSEAGIGLSATWFDPMPDFYKATSYKRSTSTMFDFASARVPDVVVINLGTNDYYIREAGNAQSPYATPENFKAKAKELIQLVRSQYGENMPIVWVSKFLGIGEDFVAAANAAISELGGESARLYRLDVTKNNGGAQGHPTVAGHVTAAAELVTFLRNKNLV